MHWALSLRPVCSLPSVPASFADHFVSLFYLTCSTGPVATCPRTCHTPPRNNTFLALLGEGRKWSASSWKQLRGLMIKKIEGLLAADSHSDSIEAPILCQTSAHRFGCLF